MTRFATPSYDYSPTSETVAGEANILKWAEERGYGHVIQIAKIVRELGDIHGLKSSLDRVVISDENMCIRSINFMIDGFTNRDEFCHDIHPECFGIRILERILDSYHRSLDYLGQNDSIDYGVKRLYGKDLCACCGIW